MVATIILLNGAGSAGKSSLARALQISLIEPWLHASMDSFHDMLPDRLQDDPDSFCYRPSLDDAGMQQVEIATGPTGRRLTRGMREAVAAMASSGNNLIVDDVIIDGSLREYEVLLAAFRLIKVGVFAPLDVLEQREATRGDRLQGLARWQYPRVHAAACYDLEVDTSTADPVNCARLIASRFGLRRKSDQPA